MSERITSCPKCFSYHVSVIKIHNPETTDLNARATFKCSLCQHEWEDLTTSPRHEEERRKGWSI